ncbi:cuticle protein 8-like [Panulirus ornatus]|uniref:cuticle protein 8-like n=1 Tax=Panulirus ornatus TaxID=150431 RepID=UPI003A88E9E0
MNAKVLLLLSLVAVAVADHRPSYNAPRFQYSSEEFGPARYSFDWAVNDPPSGNNFGQQESRDNDNTQGSYTVQLSDGRLQTVNYYVNGDSGFIADVNYDGQARYPDSFESREYNPRPRYG